MIFPDGKGLPTALGCVVFGYSLIRGGTCAVRLCLGSLALLLPALLTLELFCPFLRFHFALIFSPIFKFLFFDVL